MNIYRFIKEGKDWYIDLPDYIENGGSKGDLQMVEGVDKMLDYISEGTGDVSLIIDKSSFAGSDLLSLKERCDPYIGGGYYFLNHLKGKNLVRQCGYVQLQNMYLETCLTRYLLNEPNRINKDSKS